MARIVKFALEMKNGFQARNNINELRNHFDYGKIVGYFTDGRLVRWLANRGYEKEVTELESLNVNDDDFKKRICEILQVDESLAYDEDNVMDEELLNRLEKVRQYTADKTILDNIDKVATNQKELLELAEKNESEIYLCAESFVIPLVVENVTYIGIGNPTAVIKSSHYIDFAESNIVFKNVNFNDEYNKICDEFLAKEEIQAQLAEDSDREADGEMLWLEANEYEDTDKEKYIQLLKEAAALGHSRSMFDVGYYYEKDEENIELAKHWYENAIQGGESAAYTRLGHIYKEEKNYQKAEKCYKKAADMGNEYGMYYLGLFYENIRCDEKTAITWYRKAAELECVPAMSILAYYYRSRKEYNEALLWAEKAAEKDYADAKILIGTMYYNGEGVESSYRKAFEWYENAAKDGSDWGMVYLAGCYERGDGVAQNWSKAYEWYSKAAEAGNENAQEWLEENGSTEAKKIKQFSENAIAELCSVIIHGRLENGTKIWQEEGSRSDGDFRLFNYKCWDVNYTRKKCYSLKEPFWSKINEYNELSIGMGYYPNIIDSCQYIVFTTKRVYVQDEDGNLHYCPYSIIKDVILENENKLYCKLEDESTWWLPDSKKWINEIGGHSMRMFLLIMGKIFGECEYNFSMNEITMLSKVKLESLGGKSILEYM
ncbi:tetratricopeptide repeat protein [Selenomonas ruminantium]|uniref:tetratricopeptide repeat protein n=1 Tax=Selenomonas ruminantium TaxID=971 RepID=UPI00041C6FF9|nr:tetratricopeptide repeat protein [Selenomonas ruminantium]